MNKAVRMASRSTLAIGLTLLAVEIYPNPVAVRGLLCASLVSGLPTFHRVLMRQRFLLMWTAAGVGMLTEMMFRDAPWFFTPFYFALVCLVFFLGSKSRDTATMVIIAYGLSGSLLNAFPGSGDKPILDGFFRAFWCSFGLLAGSFAFLIFPIPKPPATASVRPVSYPVRDSIFLGACAVVSLFVGLIAAEYLASAFLVMVTLVWGITLCSTRDKSRLPMTYIMGIAALLLALAFDSVISSSTNNLMVFMSAFLAIVWLINWLRVSFAYLSSTLSWFLIIFLTGSAVNAQPDQTFHATLINLYSILTGIVVATILWVIDQCLRSVEVAAEQYGKKEVAC